MGESEKQNDTLFEVSYGQVKQIFANKAWSEYKCSKRQFRKRYRHSLINKTFEINTLITVRLTASYWKSFRGIFSLPGHKKYIQQIDETKGQFQITEQKQQDSKQAITNINLNSFLKTKAKIPSVCCPSCQQYLHQKWPIIPGSSQAIVAVIQKKTFKNPKKFNSWICAILNAGGGFLYIQKNPYSEQGQNSCTQGIQLSLQSKQDHINKIKMAINFCSPKQKVSTSIDFLPLYRNQDPEKQNSRGTQTAGFVIRIMLKPVKMELPMCFYLDYAQNKGKNRKQYEIYRFKSKLEKNKVIHEKINTPEEISARETYNSIITGADCKVQLMKNHREVVCLEPEKGEYKSFVEEEDTQELSNIYENYAVVISNTQEHYKKLCEQLRSKKIQFVEQKLFSKWQDKNKKQNPIYIFNYSQKYEILAKLIYELNKEKQIRTFRLFQTLTISPTVDFQPFLKSFNQLLQYYPADASPVWFIKENGSQKPKVCFSDCFQYIKTSAVLYAYMTFCILDGRKETTFVTDIKAKSLESEKIITYTKANSPDQKQRENNCIEND